MRFLLALALLLALDAASAIPQNQQAPEEVEEASEAYANDDTPGFKCRALALEHWSLVLTDSVNRQDHLALALAYDAFANAHLAC